MVWDIDQRVTKGGEKNQEGRQEERRVGSRSNRKPTKPVLRSIPPRGMHIIGIGNVKFRETRKRVWAAKPCDAEGRGSRMLKNETSGGAR